MKLPGSMPKLTTKLKPIRVKLVTVGDSGVGKTCFFIRQCKDDFPRVYVPDAFEKYVLDITIDETNVEVVLEDVRGTTGDYARLRHLHYTETDVFAICFDLTNPKSYENVSELWYPELKEHCLETPIILVGMKLDLREDEQGNPVPREDETQIITYAQGQEMKSKIGALEYFECSAATGKGVHNVFYEATCHALGFYLKKKKSKSCNLL